MAHRLGVDVGGPLPTCCSSTTKRAISIRVKTPSTPADPSEGVLVGVRRICDESGIEPGELGFVMHGTTVATNAMLEAKGARVGLITTQGFGQILHLARSQTPGAARGLDHHGQAGPARGARGHPRGEGADERPGRAGRAGRPGAGGRHRPRPGRLGRRDPHRLAHQLVREPGPRAGDQGDHPRALPRLPRDDLLRRAAGVPGVRADADGVHELVRAPARGELRPQPRGLAARARRQGRAEPPALRRRPHERGRRLREPDLRHPLRAVGGVAGALYIARRAGFENVLTFDMGGTSTDVALCQNGQPTIERQTEIPYGLGLPGRGHPRQGPERQRPLGRGRRRVDRARSRRHRSSPRRPAVGRRGSRPALPTGRAARRRP